MSRLQLTHDNYFGIAEHMKLTEGENTIAYDLMLAVGDDRWMSREFICEANRMKPSRLAYILKCLRDKGWGIDYKKRGDNREFVRLRYVKTDVATFYCDTEE